ncbi:S-locus receptor kinase (SRK) [Zostera marina]|uniref:Receptor-like serine/threonine-protein kinase n=1 Tax=Zostera marina TaxID=29655 RepID=A0A0K9NQT5_ZOSMR|nr:S-locus receptor kinase (SRK) [Zostera marina]
MTWMSSCSLPALSLALILLVSSKINPTQAAKDSINQIQGIKEGETLVSKNNIYVLGFFQTSGKKSSTKFGRRYLGIWYKFSNDTVVWVANRQNPITDTSSLLSLGSNGELMVEQTDEASNITTTVWSSNSRRYSNITNPIASLLDSGNLVITSEGGGDLIWQSFDYPTDTLLPGMKLGFDKVSGKQWNNTSWSQENDPSIGEFVFKIMATESHENVVAKIKTNEITYRGGTWNGHRLSGNPGMSTYNGILNLSFIDNQNIVFYTYQTIKKNEYSRLKLFPNGSLMRSFWTVDVPRWITYWTQDTCDTYSRCGPNGICNLKNDIFCDCFPGYRPKSNNSWINRDYSQGCVMKKKLNCVNGENNFLFIENIKIPNTINSSIDRNITLDACKIRCLNNCSCLAYASFYILPNKGCILWFGDLIDTKTLDGNGQKIYLRLPSSEILTDHSNGQHKKRKIVIIAIIVLGLIVLSYVGISLWNKKMKVREVLGTLESSNDYNRDDIGNWKEKITLFDLSVISQATNNFSTSNKIGEGGFGLVYKGTLLNGKEIAVKKLSNVNSGHGLNDFMNEAMLIQQLRHRNLVRFLGCCMEGEERLLIYEFVPNKSLDIIIFGENKHVLDWKMRVEIIIGIARGLLYLHQDSALRIIHRDLKAGNILLDEVMNPKITDFGTARLFESNQVEGNTRRVIGTPGYMSPEYITNGNFSMKSDVFSFGILLLEIITGKRNRVSYKTGLGFNLLDQCWTIWKDGNILELVDESLHCLLSTSQVFRFVKIGLLCVQDLAIDRPLMSNVLFMLSNENSHIPDPKRSRFWSVDQDIYGPSTSSGQISYIVSDLNFTKLDAR